MLLPFLLNPPVADGCAKGGEIDDVVPASSAIVDNFNFVRISAPPYEADPKLIVYPDAVLTPSGTLQSLEMISSCGGKVAKHVCGVQCFQFSACNALDIPQCRYVLLLEQSFGADVAKALDH